MCSHFILPVFILEMVRKIHAASFMDARHSSLCRPQPTTLLGFCYRLMYAPPSLIQPEWVTEDRQMIIGDRLRALRDEKNFSQGDIEEKTGLLRCYISRVENGHTVPAVETLEKFARALEVPMYQLFYDGEEPPKLPKLPTRKSAIDIAWGNSGKDARMLAKFCQLFSRMEEGDRATLFFMAQKMARKKTLAEG
jgi:transcriptional regulator with XRE-family HTH domain